MMGKPTDSLKLTFPEVLLARWPSVYCPDFVTRPAQYEELLHESSDEQIPE
jgi:hypothetical protein